MTFGLRTSLAVLALLAACSKHTDKPSGPTTAATSLKTVRFDAQALARLGVRVEAAGSAEDAQTLKLPGTIEYNLERYAEVGTLLDGRVSEVSARVGDRVSKGQRLATLLVPEIVTAQADFLSVQAASATAREHLRREQSLSAQQLTTARELELAQGDSKRVEAELAAATARLRVLGADLPTSGASIRTNGSLTLTSPIDGVVVRRDAVLGSFLRIDDAAFVIADPSSLWATIDVFEADIPYVGVGSSVVIESDSAPGLRVEGQVALMEPGVGKASRSVRARVQVANPSGAFRPGTFVRATVPIAAPRDPSRPLVPTAAVQPLGEHDVVFVEREPGVFEIRTVEVARRTSQVVELSGGLERGERIAVAGAFLLRAEATKQ